MLWTRRKIIVSPPTPGGAPDTSGYRPSEPSRALDALGTVLSIYSKFAFDTERSAAEIRQECAQWAQRILLGEPRPARGDAAGATEDAPPPVARDWHGLERFFTGLREQESAFVVRSIAGLRKVVLELARSLAASAGEDQESDAAVEERLSALSGALQSGELARVSRAAAAVIETTRGAMARRRAREAGHIQSLGKELRRLQDELGADTTAAGTDAVTGLYSRAAYEQQLEQLAAIGTLLDPRPWLIVIAPELPRRPGASAAKLSDDKLREASKCVNRTFLRRLDFVARTGQSEFSVLLADMTREQVSSAAERLLGAARELGRGARRNDALSFSIGMAQLRPSEDVERWRARAEVALGRSRQDGGDGFTIA